MESRTWVKVQVVEHKLIMYKALSFPAPENNNNDDEDGDEGDGDDVDFYYL